MSTFNLAAAKTLAALLPAATLTHWDVRQRRSPTRRDMKGDVDFLLIEDSVERLSPERVKHVAKSYQSCGVERRVAALLSFAPKWPESE